MGTDSCHCHWVLERFDHICLVVVHVTKLRRVVSVTYSCLALYTVTDRILFSELLDVDISLPAYSEYNILICDDPFVSRSKLRFD